MKKRKLLLLFALVTCVLMLFTGCGKETASASVLDYFAPSDGKDVILSQVKDLDGKIVATDSQNGLVAVERSNADSTDLKIYDLNRTESNKKDASPRCIYSTTSYGQNTRRSVTFSYPLFVIETATEYSSQQGGNTDYSYDCYLYQSYNGEYMSLASNLDTNSASVFNRSGLYEIRLENTVYWTDGDGRILREFFKDITSGYNLPTFKAEYKGYLYLHEFSTVGRRLQVFNKEGICQVMYSHPQNTFSAEVYVLNDGNVFVEEWMLANEGEAYDILYLMPSESGKYTYEKVIISSKIVNFQTGEVTELPLEFSVLALESAYTIDGNGGRSYLPFALSEKRNNQAIVRRFSDGSFAVQYDYVVLDNLMNVLYTYAPKLDSDASDYEMLPDGRVIATVMNGGAEVSYLLDVNGKILCRLPAGECRVFGEYILAKDGVYDLSMKKLFDFEGSFIAGQFGGKYEQALSFAGNLCLKLYNPLTDSELYYVFDGKTFVQLARGENEELWEICDGKAYVVYDTEDKHYTLYAMDGTALLRTQGAMDITVLGDFLAVEATKDGKPDGEPVSYIIK